MIEDDLQPRRSFQFTNNDHEIAAPRTIQHMTVEEVKQPGHETIEIKVGNGGAVQINPPKNSNTGDEIRETTRVVQTSNQGIIPKLSDAIGDAISIP